MLLRKWTAKKGRGYEKEYQDQELKILLEIPPTYLVTLADTNKIGVGHLHNPLILLQIGGAERDRTVDLITVTHYDK